MKPIQITMQAFGCYLRRTTVDFTKLGENPLFLITGATGGGKTTILDAMCFALYCKATGGRRSWSSMVCAAAKQEAETMVDFVFSLGGETYRFYRLQQRYAARGTGALKTREEHSCYRRNAGNWELLLTGAESKVRERAERLLGLTCEQFSQVMVLPQGDFLKLLLASSRDKAQMFQTLFATEQWAKVTLILKKMADGLQQQAGELSAAKKLILEREEAETAEQLEEKCLDTEQCLEAEGIRYALLQKELEHYNSEFNAALELTRKFERAEALRTELLSLKKQEEEIGRKTESLKLSRLAGNVIPYYTAYQAAHRDLSEKQRRLENAKRTKELAQEEYRTASEQVPQAKKHREAATILAQTFTQLDTARVGAQRLKKIRACLKEDEAILAERNRFQEQSAASLKDAQERCQKGVEYIRQAQEKYLHLPQLMAQVQAMLQSDAAAALATGLREGGPCPVCGSVHHPVPAKQSEQLEAVQSELADAKKSGEALEKYEKRLNELEKLQQKEQQKFEQGKAKISEIEMETASQRAAEKELLQSLGEFYDADKIEKEIHSVQNQMKKNAEQADQLEARFATSQSALAASTAVAESAEKAYAESMKTEEGAKERLRTESAAAKLRPDTDFSSVVFSPTQEDTLEREINDYRASCKSRQEQLEALEQELKGKERPNLEAVKAILWGAQQKSGEMAKKMGSLKQSAESARKSLKKLTELAKQGNSLQERYARTSRLAAMLSGKTGLKIPLHQFVLGIMLDDILSCANNTFSVLSSGRYSLSRLDGASGGNTLGGLDLQVFDAHSGGVRSVETLSGGELFLASLSLAFGLSEVVQNYSGSVHLDSIFIDEGFGSLDQETLDTAMKALLQIQQSGRTIGIISHVSELKTRIASQIIVSKGADGGSTAEVYGG